MHATLTLSFQLAPSPLVVPLSASPTPGGDSVTDIAAKSTSNSDSSVIVGSSIGGILGFLLLILIVVIVYMVLCARKRKKTGKYYNEYTPTGNVPPPPAAPASASVHPSTIVPDNEHLQPAALALLPLESTMAANDYNPDSELPLAPNGFDVEFTDI